MEDREKSQVINELLNIEANIEAFMKIGKTLSENVRTLRLKLAKDKSEAIQKKQLQKLLEEEKLNAMMIKMIADRDKALKRNAERRAQGLSVGGRQKKNPA